MILEGIGIGLCVSSRSEQAITAINSSIMINDDERNTTDEEGTLEGGCKLSDMIPRFDGSGDVTEWLEQVQDAKGPAKIKNLANVMPAFLRGSAYRVYRNLPEMKKRRFKDIAAALTTAFGMDENVAFCQLVSRRWKEGESMDVYMTEVQRLATLADTPERVVRLVFLNGLPEKIGSSIKMAPDVKSMDLDKVLDLARRIYASSSGPMKPGPLPMSVATMVEPPYTSNEVGAVAAGRFACYGCGIEGHLVRNCPNAKQKKNKKASKEIRQKEVAEYDSSASGNADGSL